MHIRQFFGENIFIAEKQKLLENFSVKKLMRVR